MNLSIQVATMGSVIATVFKYVDCRLRSCQELRCEKVK